VADDIVIRTSRVELGLYRDEYEGFVDALRAEGITARISEPEETRSLEQAAVELGIWVTDHVVEISAGGVFLDVIRRAARDTISKRKAARKTQRLKRLPIYGSGDRIHGWVDLPAEDDEEGDIHPGG
jgi:hypothetical protein